MVFGSWPSLAFRRRLGRSTCHNCCLPRRTGAAQDSRRERANDGGDETADFPAAAQNPSARRHLLRGEALQFWQLPACQLWHRNCEETLPRGTTMTENRNLIECPTCRGGRDPRYALQPCPHCWGSKKLRQLPSPIRTAMVTLVRGLTTRVMKLIPGAKQRRP
jgi:hypothetical protein